MRDAFTLYSDQTTLIAASSSALQRELHEPPASHIAANSPEPWFIIARLDEQQNIICKFLTHTTREENDPVCAKPANYSSPCVATQIFGSDITVDSVLTNSFIFDFWPEFLQQTNDLIYIMCFVTNFLSVMQPVKRLCSTGCIRSHRIAEEWHNFCYLCLADEGGVNYFLVPRPTSNLLFVFTRAKN
jgi:hypothetical protein